MKFLTAAAIAAVSATPLVQEAESNTMWYVDGFKGFYDGYYSSFYKQPVPSGSGACLNEETIENMIKINQVAADPMAFFGNMSNIQEDFNMFREMAEVFENLATCRFEESFVDIAGMCISNPEACLFPTLSQNLTKNMFVLVGKITSLAETTQNFPAPDNAGFKE